MIKELAQFCSDEFAQKAIECKRSYQCDQCLKEIHYDKNSVRRYDCAYMCYWYVCKNIYRYSTEMVWLFHNNGLKLQERTKPIIIWSIGCGPCSELIAFEEYYAKKQCSFDYSYIGFDQNDIWKPIQEKIKQLSANSHNIEFYSEDVFEYYKRTQTAPNVIILNYMLSDMLKYNPENFQSFLTNLYDFLSHLPSFALLINDINSGRDGTAPRFYFASIITEIRKLFDKDKICAWAYHFKDSKKRYFEYGAPRDNNTLLFKIDENIINNFSPNTECHSAQLCIIKYR